MSTFDSSLSTSHTKTRAAARPKLRLSAPGDAHEREADIFAERVTGGPASWSQTACACGGGCPRCAGASASPGDALSRVESLRDGVESAEAERAAPLVEEVLGRPGEPLDGATRDFMEPRFGFDFGRVRLHRDALAGASAKAVTALAYTVGSHVVFGAAQYAPGSESARALLAHELAHVVQQSRAGGGAGEKVLTLQRQHAGAPQAATGAGGAQIAGGAQGADLRRAYIALACEAIADIRAAVAEGRVWDFENDFLLQGEEELEIAHPTRVEERREALRMLTIDLAEIIGRLDSGALSPTEPASRQSLRAIWEASHPAGHWPGGRPPVGEPARWSPPVAVSRSPGGRFGNLFPSPGRYITGRASSPPGTLRPASIPPVWWAECPERDTPPPTTDGGPPPPRIDLTRDTVVYLTWRGPRGSGVITGWDAMPRNAPWDREALGTRYEWQRDEATGRIFIIVGGRRVFLLPHTRIEIER